MLSLRAPTPPPPAAAESRIKQLGRLVHCSQTERSLRRFSDYLDNIHVANFVGRSGKSEATTCS